MKKIDAMVQQMVVGYEDMFWIVSEMIKNTLRMEAVFYEEKITEKPYNHDYDDYEGYDSVSTITQTWIFSDLSGLEIFEKRPGRWDDDQLTRISVQITSKEVNVERLRKKREELRRLQKELQPTLDTLSNFGM